MNVTAGDTVVFRGRSRGERLEITVDRVARKYFYAKIYGRMEAFSLENGQSPKEWGGSVQTLAQVAEDEHMKDLRETLGRHGVILEWHRCRRFTTAELEALAATAATFSAVENPYPNRW
jgi:hypothetical protein